MPPKAAAPVANEAFLAVCVKCAKSKLDVDFDLVAKATGMSKGGANNKFRAIMKQFEDEGATFTSNGTGNATTGAKAAPKRKATPKKVAVGTEAKSGEDEGDTDGEAKPAVRRAKAAPKKKRTATTKTKKKAVEASASEEDAGEDEQAAVDEDEA